MRLLVIPPHEEYSADYWAKAAPHLIRGCERSSGRYDLQSLFIAWGSAQAQLWAAEEDGEVVAALMTQIKEYPTGMRALVLLSAGGARLHDWKDYCAQIEDWARAEMGVDIVELEGRRGWARLLDLEPVALLMERRL